MISLLPSLSLIFRIFTNASNLKLIVPSCKENNTIAHAQNLILNLVPVPKAQSLFLNRFHLMHMIMIFRLPLSLNLTIRFVLMIIATSFIDFNMFRQMMTSLNTHSLLLMLFMLHRLKLINSTTLLIRLCNKFNHL